VCVVCVVVFASACYVKLLLLLIYDTKRFFLFWEVPLPLSFGHQRSKIRASQTTPVGFPGRQFASGTFEAYLEAFFQIQLTSPSSSASSAYLHCTSSAVATLVPSIPRFPRTAFAAAPSSLHSSSVELVILF
jgi:hypothetical protein